jgi:hypothetical protein
MVQFIILISPDNIVNLYNEYFGEPGFYGFRRRARAVRSGRSIGGFDERRGIGAKQVSGGLPIHSGLLRSLIRIRLGARILRRLYGQTVEVLNERES